MDRMRLAKVTGWIEAALWIIVALSFLQPLSWIFSQVETRGASPPLFPVYLSAGAAWLVSGIRDSTLTAEIAEIRGKPRASLALIRNSGRFSIILGLVALVLAVWWG